MNRIICRNIKDEGDILSSVEEGKIDRCRWKEKLIKIYPLCNVFQLCFRGPHCSSLAKANLVWEVARWEASLKPALIADLIFLVQESWSSYTFYVCKLGNILTVWKMNTDAQVTVTESLASGTVFCFWLIVPSHFQMACAGKMRHGLNAE